MKFGIDWVNQFIKKDVLIIGHGNTSELAYWRFKDLVLKEVRSGKYKIIRKNWIGMNPKYYNFPEIMEEFELTEDAKAKLFLLAT